MTRLRLLPLSALLLAASLAACDPKTNAQAEDSNNNGAGLSPGDNQGTVLNDTAPHRPDAPAGPAGPQSGDKEGTGDAPEKIP